MLVTLLRNVRHSIRALSRTPVFTATVVLTLALGIGANAAVFSAIDAVLLRPLPFPDGERLMRLAEVREGAAPSLISPVRLADWNGSSSTFEAITGYYVEDVSDTTGDLPESVQRATVMPDFLEVWGISPALGRGFTDDDHRGLPSTVLISDRYWRNRFGADPGAIERAVRIGDRSYSIAGVMPPSFLFPDRDVDWWVPHSVDAPFAQSRELGWFLSIGRLEPGVTLEQAFADLRVVQAQLAEQHPDTDRDLDVHIEPFQGAIVAAIRGHMWLVYGAVSVLLLIACTNVATLLLTRAAQRAQEFSVRYSLGASMPSVAAVVLTEAALLALAGGALGLLIAAGAIAAFSGLAANLPRIDEVVLDGRIVLYTLTAAAVVTVLCGVVPAIRGARGSLAGTLVGASRAQVSTRQSLPWLLVGAQVALSIVLLAGAGLLLRSFQELARVDLGFEPQRVLTFRVSGSFADMNDWNAFQQQIDHKLEELRTLPGIESTATSQTLPGLRSTAEAEFGLTAADQASIVAFQEVVSPAYFATIGIPLLAGEVCRPPVDTTGSALTDPQIMVNRAFVDRYLPGSAVIGQALRGPGDGWQGRIVGIVGNARDRRAEQGPAPTAYVCMNAASPSPYFLVRTRGEPTAVANDVRVRMNELEPFRAVFELAPLDERMGDAHVENRTLTAVLALFAATALSLASVGVYGTLGYAVSLRRREVGLRVALGALQSNIVTQFLVKALRVVGLASVAGLALSFLFTRSLSGMLFGVTPTDPATLAAVLLTVTAVAVLAAMFPALRAARIDPMQTLRQE